MIAPGDDADEAGSFSDRADDDVDKAVRDAGMLLEDGDTSAARAVLDTAIAAHSPVIRPEFLWVLADVELAEGDLAAGMRCLSEAGITRGQDAVSVSRQIRTLSRNRLRRDALSAVEAAPAEVRDDPLVREAIGEFYAQRGCYAHAVKAYGRSSGLSSSAMLWCWLTWITSGGPITRIRDRMYAWEESKPLTEIRRVRGYLRHLDQVAEISDKDRLGLRARIENVNYLYMLRITQYQSIIAWLIRLAPLAVAPVWLALFLIAGNVHFVSGPPGAAWGSLVSAGAGLAATLGLVAVVNVAVQLGLVAGFTWRKLVVSCAIVAVFETAIAEAYDHQAVPVTGLWSWIVLGLIAVPVLTVGLAAAGLMSAGLAWWSAKEAYRDDSLAAILNALLQILDGISDPVIQRDHRRRLRWAVELEDAASLLTKHLVPSAYVGYLASGEWLAEQVAGWSGALHQLQRQIIAPHHGARPKLQASLRHEIRCLASGDLGTLLWRPSPPPPPRRATLMHQTVVAFRSVLVAALPLVVVLATQPVLHLSSPVFNWTRIAAGVWALLYVVISLDPSIRDKIDTARSLVGTLRESETLNRPDSRAG